MNNQQFFDLTVAHLRRQVQPSYVIIPTVGTACAYRSRPNGQPWVMGAKDTLMCAIGAHIPDSVIFEAPSLNSTPFDNLLSSATKEVRAKFDNVDHTLARSMQMLHDHAAPNEDEVLTSRRRYTKFEGDVFERELQQIASRCNLLYTPPAK